MSDFDNGGAIAIKGFNYQKASIILVIINNYYKNNFKVIPESKEDFEITFEDNHFYVQVKGTKNLSLAKLIKKPNKSSNKEEKSIVEKNLLPGNDEDKRKIFLWELIEQTKKDLVKQEGTLISPVYCFSKTQQQEIENKLGLNEKQKKRLSNQKIYITPFPNDINVALTMLKGIMVEKNLFVNNERAKVVLGELALEIDQKSEIPVTNEIDIRRKEISGKYLNKVFLNLKQKELFDEVLASLTLNTIMKKKVKKEKLGIPLLHQSLKEKLKQRVDYDVIMGKNDVEAINYIRDILSELDPQISTELSVALAIECFCELGAENHDI
ncbi:MULTISPECIES: dsDNA nuclease domain-containing protein [Listeria]|uniref:dsDNA nuclease domain-containing protein n=1 Tax=Listeria TaxID=1637 RepID=UPI000B589C17|nr:MULTISPECIES: dsDNA nuclease domain-containing protein [Listeria]